MTKLEQYYKLSREKSQLLWQDKDYYLSFLRSAGQLYKYEFHDQLLIHAQNPAATACAEYDFWNDESKMNRYIKRGSKGIALIDQSGAHHRLRYVYDVSQTGRRDERSKDPYLWEVNENNRQTVIDVLGSTAEHLDTAIMEKAHELAEDYADYYSDALTNSNVSNNTFLEELDELNKRTDFSELLENSLAYVLLSRCGYEPDLYFDEYDFAKLYEFNSIGAMSVLGTAVSDITETALRSIERVIKAERSKENGRSITQNNDRERNNIRSGRDNADISSRLGTAGTEVDRQVRTNEAALSEGEQAGSVSGNAAEFDSERTSGGDRRSGEPENGNDTSRNEGESRLDGTAESSKPDEVGWTDEQLDGTGGGNSPERADLQLNTKEISDEAAPEEADAAFPLSDEQHTETAPEQEENRATYSTNFAEQIDNDEPTHQKFFPENSDDKFRYQLLSRMQSDCNYMLGNGGAGAIRYLDGENVDTHINNMLELYNSFSDNAKPEWISVEEIEDYREKLTALVAANEKGIQQNPVETAVSKENENAATNEITVADLSVGDKIKYKDDIWEVTGNSPVLGVRIRAESSGLQITIPANILQSRGFEVVPAENSPLANEIAEPFNTPDFTVTAKVREELLKSEQLIPSAQNNELSEFSYSYFDVAEDIIIAMYNDDTNTFSEDEKEYMETLLNDRDELETMFAPVMDEVYNHLRDKTEVIEEIPETAENTEEVAEVEEAEEYDDEEFQLKVGDVIELDDGKFKITDIANGAYGRSYELQDLTVTGWFPIFRNIREDDLFERGFSLVEEAPVKAVPEAEVDNSPAPNIADVPQLSKEKHDFVITDENLGTGGAKTKFKNNVAAIRLLNELEAENRLATPEEQEVLSKYVGWGGMPQAFDENNSAWADEFLELYTLLSPDEYESARASTLNAHYTSPTVIKAIYEGLENLGFKGGNVLEPAMGVGNFYGCMPEEMRNSKLYGVELDEISGRIAKQLYQTAKIQVTGFEKTAYPDNFFDVAIGNVPFGQYKLSEKRYDKLNLPIHDHFFAKSLDKVRAGGVVAFVTSKGTLDKANPQFRRYIAQRAELVGAIRLPNTAFKDNARTEVTSDIIFLQKRDKMVDIEPDWVHLGATADGVPVNKYFEQHPEMILGEMKQGVEFSLYGNAEETACVPMDGADLKEQLKAAIKNIQGVIPELEVPDLEEGQAAESIPADPNVQNYSYAVVDDNIYYRENSLMFLQTLPKATSDRIKGMCELRDCVRTLIDYQLNEYSDFEIREQQARLNSLYEDFSGKYGLINSPTNERAFRDDNSYHLLSSLEILDEDGKLQRKADMFTKRTIKQRTQVTSVDTASDALTVSIGEKAAVDMPFMQQLTGKTEEQLYNDLKGAIFLNPMYTDESSSVPKYLPADEYLSGNVREKLSIADMKAYIHPEYAVNVEALTAVQPKPLQAHEIDVRLGATWVEPKYIKQFMFELLHTPFYSQRDIDVEFSKFTSEWHIKGKSEDRNNVMVDMTYGTPRKNAYSIFEDTLNLRDVRVYDRVENPDGTFKSVLNQKETTLAQQKQEAIKSAFKDWIFKDPERRETLVKLYNEKFNSTRPREYDGSHLTFSGMSPEIALREHQVNAIAHTIYGGNTLLAHQVGAGKTFEMVASAMESKRLGLCNKSMFVVPNHLTEQMGAEFLRLYPAANILVATKKDFEAKNRKRLCAKIATGDYDAVIIGHSQLEKIPISPEREERMIKNQINEIAEGIKELKSNGSRNADNFSVKQLEKTKKSLEARLKKLIESPKRDNVVTFEQLGIDKLYVDEAHSFKNLFLYTKMRNVAGIQQTEAQKSSDLYMKCQYLDEITGGKGVVFATGTPVSNSMTELYTMMRYLQSDTLSRLGMQNFDSWASNFGEAVTATELAPEGTGYRAKTRFSKFFNLPELMNMFKEAADIKTADMLNLPVPEAKFHNIVVQPTDMQREMVSALSERAKLIHNKAVMPEEDNMLKVTNDGRKIGLDQRLIDPLLPDDPCSKVNTCINNVFDIYTEHSDKKSAQLIFCDFSTPKNDGSFNLYDDIRTKLVAKGVPKNEIAFIHEADTEVKKKELFAKVRSGQVRVLLGSTAKCGAGTNIQDKLIALHHLDCPWRPSDLEQREGRIIRQGNENPSVDVYRYVTEATFDAYLYQTIENKQRFISQIMTSKSPMRSMEDVDEATLSYAEVKALCAGNPLIKEKMDLDVEVTKLKVAKSNHTAQQYSLEDRVLKTLPQSITRVEQRIDGLRSDCEHFKAQPIVVEGISPMTVCNAIYTDKEAAGQAILKACKNVKANADYDLGTYKGFSMTLSYDSFAQEYHLDLQREATHRLSLSPSALGNITRIDNALAGIENRLNQSIEQLAGLKEQLETAKGELGKPFPMEQELSEKSARLAELELLLKIDDNSEHDEHDLDEHDVESEVDEKPGINAKPSIIKQISEIKSEQAPSKPDKPIEKNQSASIDI